MQQEAAATARIVTTPRGTRFALPVHSTLEIVEHPAPLRVPGSARHAMGLLSWHGRRIAFVDADAALGDSPRATHSRYALVLAWQRQPHAPVEHGAIAIDTLPETVQVRDTAQCAAPESIATRALSCFLHEGEAIPVIDASCLFAGPIS